MSQIFKTNIQNTDQDVINELIKDLINFISINLKERNELFIALSGGSTPQLLFKTIAEKYLHDFPWEKLHFFWVDERCVENNSIENNYGNAYRILFQNENIPLKNLHPMRADSVPNSERIRYSAEIFSILPQKNGFPSFDLIILGMGSDGHTASIFPGQEYIFGSENVCAVAFHPETGQKRITLTGKTINNANEIVVLVTGKSKAEKVKQALTPDDISCLPIQHIRPINGNISWYLDKEAACLLENY